MFIIAIILGIALIISLMIEKPLHFSFYVVAAMFACSIMLTFYDIVNRNNYPTTIEYMYTVEKDMLVRDKRECVELKFNPSLCSVVSSDEIALDTCFESNSTKSKGNE